MQLSTFTSLVDEVEFLCANWQDPENIGIKSYLLMSTDLTTDVRAPPAFSYFEENLLKISFKLCKICAKYERLRQIKRWASTIELYFKVISLSTYYVFRLPLRWRKWLSLMRTTRPPLEWVLATFHFTLRSLTLGELRLVEEFNKNILKLGRL